MFKTACIIFLSGILFLIKATAFSPSALASCTETSGGYTCTAIQSTPCRCTGSICISGDTCGAVGDTGVSIICSCSTPQEAKACACGGGSCTPVAGVCSGTIGCNSICDCNRNGCSDCNSNKNPGACCTDSFHFNCTWNGSSCSGGPNSYQCQVTCGGLNDQNTCQSAGCSWSPYPQGCVDNCTLSGTCSDSCGNTITCTPTNICGPHVRSPSPTYLATNVSTNTTFSWTWEPGYTPSKAIAVYLYDVNPEPNEPAASCGPWKTCIAYLPKTATSVGVSGFHYYTAGGQDKGVLTSLTPGKTYYWKVVPDSDITTVTIPKWCNFSTINASCTVTLSPNPASVQSSSTVNFAANVIPSGGSVDRVDFTSTNTSIATVNPASDSDPLGGYTTVATGRSLGTTNINANVIMGGATRCSASSSLTVTNPGPWWQVKDADVITNGNLTSQISTSCSLPGCNPAFDIDGTGGYPGVPTYSGSYDFNAGTGLGTISSKSWNANTQTSSGITQKYNYQFFQTRIPSDVQANTVEINASNPWNCTAGNPAGCSVSGGNFENLGTPTKGFVWFHYGGATYGDLTINSSFVLNGSRKVILLVEGANLIIGGKITINQRGQGFFMAIVGKNTSGQKGNIFVDSTVSSPNLPAIEGIYFADNTFCTTGATCLAGNGNNWLYVRGAVAAMGGITLQRNLTNNSAQPAEYFEYAPDLTLLYPGVFKTRPIKWKEVAP